MGSENCKCGGTCGSWAESKCGGSCTCKHTSEGKKEAGCEQATSGDTANDASLSRADNAFKQGSSADILKTISHDAGPQEEVYPTIFSHHAEPVDTLVDKLRARLMVSMHSTAPDEAVRKLGNAIIQGSYHGTLQDSVNSDIINFGIPYNGSTPAKNVDAGSPVDSAVVADFHSKRLLFIVIGPKVYAETTPSGMSHIEWIKTLAMSDTITPYNKLDAKKDYNYIMDNFTRGYHYNNAIVLYKGLQFEADLTVVDTIRYCMKPIVKALELKNDTLVGLGCIVKESTIFEVAHKIGTVSEVSEMDDFSEIYNQVNTYYTGAVD